MTSKGQDILNEAVERMEQVYESGSIYAPMGKNREALGVLLAAAKQASQDRRKAQAEALRWAATGIAARAENLKPYPRGAVRNVAKLMNAHAGQVERGEIEVKHE